MCVVTQLCPTLWNPTDHSPLGPSVHGDYPGKDTWVGCPALLQGIFPTQGLNPGLPHCRWILYHLSHQGSPRILERVACPFSRGASQPRNRTRASCIAGRFFTSWATREDQNMSRPPVYVTYLIGEFLLTLKVLTRHYTIIISPHIILPIRLHLKGHIWSFSELSIQ